MLTLFSIPKPFRGHTRVIQLNAISSWNLLRPRPEIILFGDEEGTAEVAEEFGLRQVTGIACNEYGTPLVNALFENAQAQATYDCLCYVNADVVLMNDVMRAMEQVARQKQRFLMVGQRWDVDLAEPWDFQSSDWEAKLRAYARENGRLHEYTGIDYFVFTRGLWNDIPPFAVGRTVWDNWLLYRARETRSPLIDATQVVMALHQNHGYSQNGKDREWIFQGPEAERNLELAGGWHHVFTLLDATHILTPVGLKRALDLQHSWRHLHTLPMFSPHLRLPVRLFLKTMELSYPLRARIGLTLSSRSTET